MHGELGAVAVAQAAPVARTERLAAAPRAEPREMQLAAGGPPSLRADEVIGAPPPPAPPQAFAARPAPVSRPALAASRGYWPALIPQAHAETLHGSLAPAAPPARRPAPVPARNAGRIFVQAGAFAVPENAQRVRARIAALGSVEIVRTANGRGLYQVRARTGGKRGGGGAAAEQGRRKRLSRSARGQRVTGREPSEPTAEG